MFGKSTARVKLIHVVGSGCGPAISSASSSSSSSSSSQTSSSQINSSSGASNEPLPASAGLAVLLRLTNISSVSAAAALDAGAAAGLRVPELQQLMRVQQQLWCSAGLHKEPLPGSTTVQFANVTLYVHAANDIVSSSLSGEAHSWEGTETQEMLWALRQSTRFEQLRSFLPRSSLQPGSWATSDSWRRPLMVDVGANLGWFSLNAAAFGARVAAFEAMDANMALLRRSLCASPWLAERIALFGTGLGTKATTCWSVSAVENRGDGHTVCGSAQDAQRVADQMGSAKTTTYKVRGAVSIRRLDSLVDEPVWIMKLDVEGFELQVLRGASGLLPRVMFLLLECNKDLLHGASDGVSAYLRFLDDAGFSISQFGFAGPFFDAAAVADGTAEELLRSPNLFCVRKELHAARVALEAGVRPGLG